MTISDEDLKELPETVLLPGDRNLNVIIEGCPLKCFECEQKGHIKRRCPLHTSEDVEDTEHVGSRNENEGVTMERWRRWSVNRKK